MAFPILLAHGIARFDAMIARPAGIDDDADDGNHYFRKILSTLKTRHEHVYHSNVEFAASIETRSESLWRNVCEVRQRHGAAKVHIIAHSMGGLDARHMMFNHGAQGYDAVASLSTIGTPHRGTVFADRGIASAGWVVDALAALGIADLAGFRDLTRAACEEFNQRARAAEAAALERGLVLRTYAGTQRWLEVFTPLKPSWVVIHEGGTTDDERANDGLVSLASARWDAPYFQRSIDADHFNECGWADLANPSIGPRILDFYLEIAEIARS